MEESGGYETIRYGNEWGWLSSKPAVGVYGVCLWKHIRKGWETFSGFIRYKVAYGTNVHFWQDWWCGERALKEVFISQFRHSGSKEDAALADLLRWRVGQVQQDIIFSRALQDWENSSL